MTMQTNPIRSGRDSQSAHEGRTHQNPATLASHDAKSHHDQQAGQDYDDGLVHGHFWAMSTTLR